MFRGMTRLLAAGAFLVAATTAASATVFYNDTTSSDNVGGAYQISTAGGGTMSASFSISGSSQIDLTDVLLGLGGGSGSSQLVVTLHNDNGGTPPSPGGASVAVGTVLDSQVSANGIYDFHVQSGIALNPGRYWIQVADTDGASWNFVQPISGTGTTGEYYTADSFSNVGQSNTNGGLAFQMCISTSVNACNASVLHTFGAPEPASLALLGVAVIGLGLARSRRYV